MFELIAKLVGSILELAVLKEKQKYVDELISLKTQWNEEYNKPDSARSDAVLDNLELKLRILAVAITSKTGASDSTH